MSKTTTGRVKAPDIKSFAVGARVKFTRRNGQEAKGRVVGHAPSSKGGYVVVDTGSKDAPDTTNVRASALKKF